MKKFQEEVMMEFEKFLEELLKKLLRELLKNFYRKTS